MKNDDVPDSAMESACDAYCGPKAYGAYQKDLLSKTDRGVVERIASAMHEYAKAFAAEAVREEREAIVAWFLDRRMTFTADEVLTCIRARGAGVK